MEIALDEGVHSVLATEPIEAEETILQVEGVVVDRPSRYSIQIGEHLHIEVPMLEGLTPESERYPWRYLNHSCDPSAALVGRRLVALRPIRRGEQITFDYNTTEFDMASPFECGCGCCDGSVIRGFKFLPLQRQRALYPRLADYLRRWLDGNGAS